MEPRTERTKRFALLLSGCQHLLLPIQPWPIQSKPLKELSEIRWRIHGEYWTFKMVNKPLMWEWKDSALYIGYDNAVVIWMLQRLLGNHRKNNKSQHTKGSFIENKQLQSWETKWKSFYSLLQKWMLKIDSSKVHLRDELESRLKNQHSTVYWNHSTKQLMELDEISNDSTRRR